MLRSRIALLGLLTAISTATGPSVALDVPPHARLAAAIGERAGERPLPFFYDLYTFRGEDGETDIVAAFAVPAGRLESESESGRTRYRFDVSLVLADTALSTLFRTDDSVYVDLPRRLALNHLLYTHIEVQAAPSATTLHRVIMTDATTPGIGTVYGDELVIRDYSGSELMVSDIALGQPDAEAGWRRGEVTLALLPTDQFPTSAFDVYYEIYNLPAGHRYATEISVEPVDDDGSARGTDQAASVRFMGESTSTPEGLLPQLRRVDTSLERGRHRITVTITDQDTGLRTRGSRIFEVHGWPRGVTMVPALPHATTHARLPGG